MSPVKTAVKFGMYRSDRSIAERFDDVVSVGLDGVEMGYDEDLVVSEVRAASAASGLAVPTLIAAATFEMSLSSADPAERQQAGEAVSRAVDAACAIGADVVMLNPGWDRAAMRPDDTALVVREALTAALDLAESVGVILAIENLWNEWLSSATDLAAFVDSFDSDNVAVLFDSGNAARFSPPQHWIETLGRRIVRFDVKDYKKAWARRPATVYAPDAVLRAAWGEGGPWGTLDALLFEGDVSWPLVAVALRASGYDGWCCAEHGPGGLDWIARFATDLRTMTALFEADGEQR